MIKIDVKFEVDLKKYARSIEKQAEKRLMSLMNAAVKEWKSAASRELHSTRRAYREAIQAKLVNPYTAHFYLQHTDDRDNWLVNALELGHPPMPIWKSTLAGPKAFHYSPWAKRANQKKDGALGCGLKSDPVRFWTEKAPFMDVPIYYKGGNKRKSAKEPSKPIGYRRLSPGNAQKWTHPGFKPIGKAGLNKPLREEVIEYIKSEAPKVLGKIKI